MSANKNRWDNLARKNAVNEQTKQEKDAILDNIASNTQDSTQTSVQPNTQFSTFVHQMDIQKHKTIEQTHTRKNYLIKNEIVAQLEKESEKHPRGWPTKLINGLLESYFLELKRLREK